MVFDSLFAEGVHALRTFVLPRLKIKKTATYPNLVDELIEMPYVCGALDLNSILVPSTLCKVFGRLEMAI
ncbi:hypothetical protein [Haladaptatus litoreus]|uniref:hypothetical protein n=1 Tax=Haladaptatus litoreus TaxID=553468 RepID=UPI000970ECA2|nr:hypothetical protein [Haladaptatus litoreus]